MKWKLIIFIIFLNLLVQTGWAAHTKHHRKVAHHTVSHHPHKKPHHLHKLHNNHHCAAAHHAPRLPNYQSVSNDIVQPTHTSGFVTSIRQGLVQFVKNTVATLSYSAYKLGGSHFDPQNGIYVLDCSSYVDNTLRTVNPNAYLSLINSTGTDRPSSLNYYDFFKELPQQNNAYWSKIDEVEQLQPGDIVVFRYKKIRRNANGHVMVVMNRPIRYGNIYMLSVADSAPEGHSQDTRLPHVSGIGIGTLLFRVNPETGQPFAYAWKIGSPWKGNVNFAMARPIENQITQFSNSFFHWQS